MFALPSFMLPELNLYEVYFSNSSSSNSITLFLCHSSLVTRHYYCTTTLVIFMPWPLVIFKTYTPFAIPDRSNCSVWEPWIMPRFLDMIELPVIERSSSSTVCASVTLKETLSMPFVGFGYTLMPCMPPISGVATVMV